MNVLLSRFALFFRARRRGLGHARADTQVTPPNESLL